ncbi:Pentatricopeptide repeat-containing protein [Sesamum alatum]|uniref:Pentatricopeptide repeat-containing protein n=1 Tax=Sesamum alatum TaxID=300844 RepID=A0AAE2CVK3_9LAMI|nr:Pentatricopeptide repeat-containing protein [Sesamum alatum]
MAKLLRFRTLLLSQSSKPCSISSLSSSSDMKSCNYAEQNHSLSANIRDKALCLLNCCRSSNHLFQIQAHLITSGLFQDPSFSGRLLKLSLKLVDDLCYTFLIFKCIDFPDAFCVNTVVKSYSCSGYHRKAVVFYVDMLRGEMMDKIRHKDESAVKFDNDVKLDEASLILPDEVTFIGILCACARKGMLTEGRDYLSQMIDVFHVKPNFAHYWCMANLMANIGLMQEAVDILRNIPIDEDVSPESSFWAGLFGSCRFQGDVSLAEQTAKGLIEQDPQNFSHHNLLVNIYAAAGRWEEVARTKELMKGRGIKRVPCCSLKDLKEIVSNVKVGDTQQKERQMALME